ncbi:MAG: phenylalanine--tRNA ligase subunit beta [Candidatus Dojkabacteria bacterium]|nr:phenylalanine--tRNA ligase subunit beta [Candidatus Dojkabacteria bacterium]
MKLPVNNIKDYTKVPDDIEKIVEILSNKVGEVEDFKNLEDKYANIFIAEIVDKKDHPDADKLAIYQISLGSGDTIQVVAGDKNIQIGDKVAYIKPGGIIPSTYDIEPLKIEERKMRGIISNGMMCSERELDIGTNHERVLILPKDAPIGELFSKYYQLNDTVINIENKALTNRGDLFGILGLAREISGAQDLEFKSPDWYQKQQIELIPDEVCLNLDVDNQAEALCPRYCAIAMTNIEIKESPVWLKSILLKSDIKPINNVVDITNYLMVLTGQPLHAFDFDKVINTDSKQADMGHIVIRLGQEGESIHALDGNIYELSDSHLIIANSQNPIAIAGIIGGIDTEIDESTRNIIIESANFDRFSLRRTSMDLGIVTDASTRFTRAQSPDKCSPIISYAVSMMEELANGELATTLIDSYPIPQKEILITLDSDKLRERIGTDIPNEQIVKILKDIEYKNIKVEDKYITVTVPSFRLDIEIEEDIYEDIVRIYGYEKITPRLPEKSVKSSFKPQILSLKEEIRNILSNYGSNELISYSFTNQKFIESVNQDLDSCIKITNPLSKDLEFMRPSIILSLLEKARLNTQQGIDTFSIFEMGISHQNDVLDDEKLPLEEWKLSFLFTDAKNNIEGNPFFESKRYLEKLLKELNVENIEYTLIADADYKDIPKWIKVMISTFNQNSSAIVSVKVGDSRVYLGILGEIDPKIKDSLSLNKFTSGFEINLNTILNIQNKSKYNQIESKYPYLTQDISFLAPDKITYRELFNKVNKALEDKDLRYEIKCIDIYKEKDNDIKKITLRISVSNITKTLNEKDMKEIKNKIQESVTKLNISM